MKQKIYGVIPPISTPIDEHEHVDEKALRKLIDTASTRGCTASLCAVRTASALA